MKRIDILKRAGRNLKQSKLRTILTALAIAIGSFAIMSSLALGTGTRSYIEKAIKSNINEKALQITMEKLGFSGDNKNNVMEYSSNYSSKYESKVFTEKDFNKIKKLDSLDRISAYQEVKIKHFEIEGSNKKWISSITSYDENIKHKVKFGKLPKFKKEIEKDEIVIPENYLKTMGLKKEDVLNKNMSLTFIIPPTEKNIREFQKKSGKIDDMKIRDFEKGLERKYDFKVVAITEEIPLSIGSNIMMINSDKYSQIGDDIARGTDNYKKYFSIFAMVKDGVSIDKAKKDIEKLGYSAMSSEDLQDTIFQFINIIQFIVIGFGVISLIVSIFGIVNTMYVSVMERTSQIGLMKALGMSSKNVGKVFRYEAAWIGFIGSSLGVILSYIIGTLLNPWISEKVGFEPNTYYLLEYDWVQAVVLIVVLILVAILSGLFPARKAVKLDPIKALRTE